jgi:hypothetical protein
MDSGREPFPPRMRLWQGAILGTIAHAIWIVADPLLAAEQSWDGPNYNVQDSMGSRGTITFAGERAVGVFFDAHSRRSPFRSGRDYDLRSFFTGISDELYSLAQQEALQYVLDDYRGALVPIITAAFWSEGEFLAVAEPWPEVVTNGAHLVSIQLMEPDAAMVEWREECEMSPSQVALMRSLFDRKMATPNAPVVLEDSERDILTSEGDEGIDESRRLLAAIGIIVP